MYDSFSTQVRFLLKNVLNDQTDIELFEELQSYIEYLSQISITDHHFKCSCTSEYIYYKVRDIYCLQKHVGINCISINIKYIVSISVLFSFIIIID